MTRVRDIVTVKCASSHLTSFAVLVDVGGAQVCICAGLYSVIVHDIVKISHTQQENKAYRSTCLAHEYLCNFKETG